MWRESRHAVPGEAVATGDGGRGSGLFGLFHVVFLSPIESIAPSSAMSGGEIP